VPNKSNQFSHCAPWTVWLALSLCMASPLSHKLSANQPAIVASVKLPMSIESISIETEGIDWGKCLQHWAWILKKCPEFNILLVTKFGELFVTDGDGSVWFLSSSNGSYEKIANSQEELSHLLSSKEEYEYYFMPQVITMLEESIGNLGAGECYGFHIPCVFKECKFEPGNFKVVAVESYLIALGDMLGQLQSTPNGEKVSFRAVE